MTLTLTSPCPRSRKNQGHVFAIDKQRLLFVNRLFWTTSFLMPHGGNVHVTESTSPTPVSVVTSPSCVWVSLIQLMVFHINSVNRNLVCGKDKNPFVSTIYCLQNTGFQFVTNCLFVLCAACSNHTLTLQKCVIFKKVGFGVMIADDTS